MSIRKTGSFMTVDDDGRRYIIYIYTNFIKAGTFDDPNAVLEGMKEFRTSNGMHVNQIGKGKYKIVQTGVILTSDDVDAP
jgi:hypothetical protein